MTTYYFTSITANYFAKARVLCNSLKEHNPQSKFILGISDQIPSFIDLSKEPFDGVVQTKELKEIKNKDSYFFKHTITELCTAVKPLLALDIMNKYNTNVIYLDPDIGVFNNLNELENMFEDNSILLTPHQYVPENEDIYVRENEILFLKRGTYNFGFFGVKNNDEGKKFLIWWAERLNKYCFDDNLEVRKELEHDGLLGLFTDQKWGDLIPSFFDNYKVIKEPGYNVCTWNLSSRKVEHIKDNAFKINNKPLFFFHFSGFDSGAHRNELNKSLGYYPHNKDVEILSKWYSEQLKQHGQKLFEQIKVPNTYSNGEIINNFERKLYHIRKDVHNLFPNPYQVTDGLCFYNWVREEYKQYFEKKSIEDKTLKVKTNKIIDYCLPLGSKKRYYVKKMFLKLFKNCN